MNSISHSNRYLPHENLTRFHAVKLYRTGVGISFVCRRYHISKASLMRWNKRFDGSWGSPADKSHRPHTPHPNAHSESELKWIRDLYRRNPHISLLEMHGNLKPIRDTSAIRFLSTVFLYGWASPLRLPRLKYKDLTLQMKRYCRRSNHIPMQVLNWLSPIQKRKELEQCS